ncbi:MAG: GIY-YIG nuclease family protein [Bacteroidetes bacterium]|nr:GIY-YIG nuclease family protein [Bacteroidota bacterium]
MVYILKSKSNGRYYIGQTQCLENRLKASINNCNKKGGTICRSSQTR